MARPVGLARAVIRREIHSRAKPETGRLSPEDLAEVQRLNAEEEAEKKAEEADNNPASPSAEPGSGNSKADAPRV